MDESTYYAIVDLETTGSRSQKGDRIIQFGCVIVQGRKIVQQYGTLVHPLRKIPEQIQKLTGITQDDIQSAPYFEDVAGYLKNLLSDCIFVAHNVHFDFNFLNHELERVGLSPLTNTAIDTVELTQILFPTLDSYTLSDLSDVFELNLNRPHDALRDAEATAYLLETLTQKAEKLPLVTLETLVDHGQQLSYDTVDFFQGILARTKQNVPKLSEDYIIVEGLALANDRESFEYDYKWDSPYPETTKEKQAILSDSFQVRENQLEMMDAIHRYIKKPQTQEKESLAIEAPAGMGKTYGYLLPLFYAATKQKKAVISTYTTLLQQQLVYKDMEQLKEMLPFPVEVALLKSHRHFIDLAFYSKLLRTSDLNTQESFYLMQATVWLTETKTGDLNELSLQNSTQSFWERIRKVESIFPEHQSKWELVDFYERMKRKARSAAIIVTNHAYLLHQLQSDKRILPRFNYLVMDEAHHLADLAFSLSKQEFDFVYIKNLRKKVGSVQDEESLVFQIDQLIQLVNKNNPTLVTNWSANLEYLETEYADLLEEYLYQAKQNLGKKSQINKRIEINLDDSYARFNLRKQLKTIQVLLKENEFLQQKLRNLFIETERYLSEKQKETVNFFLALIERIAEHADFIDWMIKQANQLDSFWLEFKEKNPKNTAKLCYYQGKRVNTVVESLKKIPKIVYTSGTLFYYPDQFVLEDYTKGKIEKVFLSDSFDYAKQAQIWIPENTIDKQQFSKKEHIAAIVSEILTIAKTTEEGFLVLFNSLDDLQEVYGRLYTSRKIDSREILAQNISGSRERLYKRFMRSKGSILLGSNSFFEGIDFPQNYLKIVCLTRLPFESPDLPEVKARQSEWIKKGENPFIKDTLPKAMLNLKQGFGRLIRSKEDKGIFIIMDERFVHSSYAKIIQKSFPAEVSIQTVATTEYEQKFKDFFEN
ncbi:helicase C-terminal domain-containing protein [Lacticigenium naphthae]|uniref:helicase C-terminal domain-containing protein n=1 Tax=Lacticigenium naphthae TaxID=515351 RepID=UPI00146B35C8|nr:helicase C-terminal domain-containing protein [Lacticigenium naphthae]